MALGGFYLSLFRFRYRAQDVVLVPGYKGNILRSGFGAALKNVSCSVKHQDCQKCILAGKCPYSQIFETPMPDNSKYFPEQKYAPHPFILEPPLENKSEYKRGECIDFRVSLIGQCIDLLPYFILAFDILGQRGIGRKINGRRGQCLLEEVESINAQGESKIVYMGESQNLSDSYYTITEDEIRKAAQCIITDTVALEFLTPTRIKVGGKFQDCIDFEMLIRSLLRRIFMLSYFHCSHDPDIDYTGLVARARENARVLKRDLKWYDWSRYSSRQRSRHFMGGIIGKMAFKGNLEEFMPLLFMGEYIHIGKGTAFGLGKYAICGRS